MIIYWLTTYNGYPMDENVKNKIIFSGYQLLLEKDVTQITTRELTEKADVSLSLLHYYFKTKYDLFIT